MRREKRVLAALVLSLIFVFAVSLALESSAWARAGGGSSSGSRGGRSFSSPTPPPRTSPSPTPGIQPNPSPGMGAPGFGSSGLGRSPFWTGLAGGIAGGFLGNMLFGGRSYAGPAGAGGYGGPGLFDLLILGALIYFGYRFFKRRRSEQTAYYEEARPESYPSYGTPQYGSPSYMPEQNEVERGLAEIRRYDPSFNTEVFKEKAEDMFFRIQAAWMNRSMDGVENLLTREMKDYFTGEFARMTQLATINRLENIAVRKVEPAEVWQESGRDFITVLFTANLLDYTVDELTGQVVQGDKLNPVKFQEFWTFSRDTGDGQWQLTGINQVGEPSPR